MNIAQNIFSPEWINTLGWTLLHSLWQGVFISVLIYLTLKVLSRSSSQIRYVIACAGMLFTLVSGVVTFIILSGRNTALSNLSYQVTESYSSMAGDSTFSLRDMISQLGGYLQANMPMIVLFWIAGAFLFSLRLVGGYWYISKLRAQAIFIENNWSENIKSLASALGIERVIRLAESSLVYSPMVIGYLKPIILVPVGMFNGLSTAELETIFLHELAHIKRHDYVINMIQSFIEVIFFFNPFVWMLSNTIRSEREFCCDDTVITKNGNVLAYAKALARLEESRISSTVFALPLADNKNQLMNRIKRIMERSFKPKTERNRMMPVILLVIGLMCASWLTIQTEEKSDQQKDSTQQSVDTLKKKADKSSGYYKKITRTNKNGEPYVVVEEEFDNDIDLADIDAIPAIPSIPAIDAMINIPPMPAISAMMMDIEPIPAIPPIEVDFNAFDFNRFNFDTIPDKAFYHGTKDWEKFSEEFESRFKEKFENFYGANSAEFEKMMQEVQEKLNQEFNEDKIKAFQDQAMQLAKLGDEIPRMEVMRAQQMAMQAQQDAMQAGWERKNAEEMKAWAEKMKLQQEADRGRFEDMEKNLKGMEKNLHAFEGELKEQLIRDGYISGEDEIKDMQWKDGEIRINGKEIKESDRKKYEALHKKYFTDRKEGLHRVE
jgi:bla regulator protein BlaR1